ncbi:hypothetical protein H5410_023215 [Solanum commersonii]|uniref:Uncharacterized protein n=1 Tax=Solanum commersonii TaxID=4109 RepID=A0A9J5ZJZ4_SOLCO|nr:hypothetical protein H5410_023215 [Solanum commersonii]
MEWNLGQIKEQSIGKISCKLGQWELRENSGSGTILSYSKMPVGHGITEKLGLILLPSLFSGDNSALGHRHTAARPPASHCSPIQSLLHPSSVPMVY